MRSFVQILVMACLVALPCLSCVNVQAERSVSTHFAKEIDYVDRERYVKPIARARFSTAALDEVSEGIRASEGEDENTEARVQVFRQQANEQCIHVVKTPFFAYVESNTEQSQPKGPLDFTRPSTIPTNQLIVIHESDGAKLPEEWKDFAWLGLEFVPSELGCPPSGEPFPLPEIRLTLFRLSEEERGALGIESDEASEATRLYSIRGSHDPSVMLGVVRQSRRDFVIERLCTGELSKNCHMVMDSRGFTRRVAEAGAIR